VSDVAVPDAGRVAPPVESRRRSSETLSGATYAASTADQSVILVTDSGTLTAGNLTNWQDGRHDFFG
jgi:hypothetical protein